MTFAIPIDWQEALIGGNLGSVLLGTFLTGAYTVIFLWTLYIYFSMKKNRNKIVLSTITGMYMVSLGQLFIQWYGMTLLLAEEGNTRGEIYQNMYGTEAVPVITFFAEFLGYHAYVLADGLLVWRCANIYGHFSRAVILLMVLFVIDTGLAITGTILAGFLHLKSGSQTQRFTNQYNLVNGCYNISTAAISLIATSLICYRIYALAKNVQCPTSRNRYRSIIRMFIDSAMASTLLALINSVMVFIQPPRFDALLVRINVADQYIAVCALILSGVAPTVMVARNVMSFGNEEISPESPDQAIDE